MATIELVEKEGDIFNTSTSAYVYLNGAGDIVLDGEFTIEDLEIILAKAKELRMKYERV